MRVRKNSNTYNFVLREKRNIYKKATIKIENETTKCQFVVFRKSSRSLFTIDINAYDTYAL